MEASDWLSNQGEGGILTLNKMDHNVKGCAENGVFSCVPFCLRSLGPFERSGLLVPQI